MHTTSLLEARLRPLVANCDAVCADDQGTEESRPLCRAGHGCDTYSHGAGECFLSDTGYGSDLCLFNSHPEKWYCPTSAPLAVIFPPKVASTSGSNWVALLDGQLANRTRWLMLLEKEGWWERKSTTRGLAVLAESIKRGLNGLNCSVQLPKRLALRAMVLLQQSFSTSARGS